MENLVSCPICTLYLRPGMSLQSHLDTHPKDMIIQALLNANVPPSSASCQTPVPPPQAPVTPQIYQPTPQQQQLLQTTPQQQQQQQQINKIIKSSDDTYSLSKTQNIYYSNTNTANSVSNSNDSRNYRIHQISIDPLPIQHSPQISPQPPPTITLKPAYSTTTASLKSPTMPNPASTIRCIRNTEQKNIMILNTSSSTQMIQHTIPITTSQTALVTHPSAAQKITLIPRYTSEKYSGPPPPYSTAVSNVSSSATTSRNTIIDLTQSFDKNNQDKSVGKHNLMITTSPQQILECAQSENGEFFITEKLVNTNGSSDGSGNLKTIDYMGNEQLPETYGEEEYTYVEEVTVPMEYRNSEEFDSYEMIQDDEGPEFDDIKYESEEVVITDESEMRKDSEPETGNESDDNSKSVKVISNVQVTSNDVIILLNDNDEKSDNKSADTLESEIKHEEAKSSEQQMDEESDKIQKIVETTDNLNLTNSNNNKKIDSDKDACTEPVPSTSIAALEAQSAAATSVIRMTSEEMETNQKAVANNTTKKSSSFVFNSNRLKLNKQPKKLVLKLKKPLVQEAEELVPVQSTDSSKINGEVKEEEHLIAQADNKTPENQAVSNETAKKQVENSHDIPETKTEHYTVTFLESELTIEQEKVGHSQVQTIELSPAPVPMDMDLETKVYSEIVKNEKEDLVVVKTELNSSSSSSASKDEGKATSSCYDETAGPSNRDNIKLLPTTSTANFEQGPNRVSFLYQNERVRFSPPLSPIVYMQTYSTHSTSQDIPVPQKIEEVVTTTNNNWNNSIIISNTTATTTSTINDSRYTPSSIFEDNRSSYTDLDMCTKTNSNSLSGICGNSNGEMSNSHRRAPSLDSLNIRTDEKMPARGEISEQESNGDMEQPWHQFYPLQAYPSSYDLSTAQECWNLSKHDSQNACDSNNIQNVIINFPPLNHQDEDIKSPDLLKGIILAKTDSNGLNDSNLSGLHSDSLRQKQSRPRTYRCPSCLKVFSQLKERRIHMIEEHNHPTGKITTTVKTATVTSTQTSKSLMEQSQLAPSTSTSLLAAPVLFTEPEENPDLSVVKTETVTNNSAIVTVKNEMSRIIMNYTMLKNELELDVKPMIDESNLLLTSEPSTSQLAIPSTSATPMLPLGIKIKRTYVCATCKEEFRTLRLFDKHLRIHPAECVACGKTFHNWVNFSIHLKRHLNIKNHVCRFCSKRFVIRQKLVEHMRVHTGSTPLKCMFCNERFRRYSNLIQHRNRVHLNKRPSKKDYVCDCGEIFQSKAKLEWHQETHSNKPKSCPHCRERFTHRNSLTRHIRLSHTDKYIFEKSKTVNCRVCNETYLASSIKAHMITHSTGKKEYCCSICNKAFSTKWNLKQHNWTHASRSSKPFQCTVCPSAFIRENDFVTHMNAHKSIKPYTCNYCGCQFVRKYNWLRHTREHEKEKKFNCNICSKKFHRAYYLTEHKRIHTGERPFACNICGKTSATKTNHNKHIKIHHARDPLTAEG